MKNKNVIIVSSLVIIFTKYKKYINPVNQNISVIIFLSFYNFIVQAHIIPNIIAITITTIKYLLPFSISFPNIKIPNIPPAITIAIDHKKPIKNLIVILLLLPALTGLLGIEPNYLMSPH